MRRYWLLRILCAVVFSQSALAEVFAGESSFLDLLWLVQATGNESSADPMHDAALKVKISSVLSDGKILTAESVRNLFSPEIFARLAGDDEQLSPAEIRSQLEKRIPESRHLLYPALAAHARLLSTGFDQIPAVRSEPIHRLAEWIVENYETGRELPIIFVCTGNSRRSILGSSMGNMAAAYTGLDSIRCYSGGTKPSAFNRRTVSALKEVGFEIEPTEESAELGSEPKNPVYSVRWGRSSSTEIGRAEAMQTKEFSKKFDDQSNPQTGFAAVMICSEADAACPQVSGAALRLSLPFLDPKVFDESEFESKKYAERRDEIGRVILAAMLQARRQIDAKSGLAGGRRP